MSYKLLFLKWTYKGELLIPPYIRLRIPDDKETINLIHQNDDLVEIFYELANAGYIPQVSYECGRLTRLVSKFNKITFIL
jgi:hypothetical protein